MSKLVTVTDSTLKEFLENKIAVLQFSALWCGPCRMLGPIVDELSNEITDVTIGKLDVADNAVAAAEFKITSIPCIVFFKDGVEVNRNVGVLSKAALKAKIEGLKN